MRYVIRFMACVGLAYDPGLVCDPWPPLQVQDLPAPSPPAPYQTVPLAGGTPSA